jgi:hypothetical protein
MEVDVEEDLTWNFDFGNGAAESDEESNGSSKGESVDSEGSRITSTEETSILIEVNTSTGPAVVMPCSPPASAIRLLGDITLEETPTDRRSTIQKKPDDCHVVLRWLQLSQIIKQNMVCSDCNYWYCNRNATEIEFSCKRGKSYTSYAD